MDPIPSDARWVTIDADRVTKWIDGFGSRHGAVDTDLAEDRVSLRAADGARAWVEVPYPPLVVEGGRLLTSLALHAARPLRIGVLLVRRGGYAAGVFAGSELVASKVGSSYVQGTTRAGGWSQQRYARRRDNQAKAAFGSAADVAARVLLPELAQLQALVLGGDRAACDQTLDDPRLSALRRLPRGPWLAVPDPRLKVLQATPALFRTVRIAIHP